MKSTLIIISHLLSQLISVSLPQVVVIVFMFFVCPVLYTLCFVLIVRECFKITRKMYMSRERDLLEKFPGPTSYPIIGTLLMDMMFIGDFYEWSEKMCKRWGDPLRFWRFGKPVLFISSYTYASQLSLKYNWPQNIDMISFLPKNRGKGRSPIPEKKRFPQVFNEQADVEKFIPIFCNETTKLLNKLQEYCDNGLPFDVVYLMTKCVFKMVCQCNFGETFKTVSYDNEGKVTSYMRAFRTITKSLNSRILNPCIWHLSDSIYYNFTEEGKKTRDALKNINAFGAMAIKRQRFNRTKSRPNTISDQNCYLDTLLDSMEKCYKKSTLNDSDTITELNKSVCTFNPIAIAISRTLFLLALHPTYQQQCFKEISKIFPKDEIQSASFSSFLEQMKYLDLCLKESIRLFPPTPIIALRTESDMRLQDGRIIPQNVDIVIFCNLVQRDPKYFKEPDKFLPERHFNNMSADNFQSNWIDGIMGEYQAKVALAYLIKEYEWFVGSDENDDTKANPRQEIKLKIRKRQV